MCNPHANMFGLDVARATAEPPVSMSPFRPARTGIAPLALASLIKQIIFPNLSL